jgi:hypothetical protein
VDICGILVTFLMTLLRLLCSQGGNLNVDCGCGPCFQVQAKIFGHIPDGVGVAQYIKTDVKNFNAT